MPQVKYVDTKGERWEGKTKNSTASVEGLSDTEGLDALLT